MAAVESFREPKPIAQTDWDESQLVSSLTRLQEMHIQLRDLRETIPALVRPVHTHQATPEDLYTSLSRSASTAVNNVRSFKKIIQDPQNQALFIKAKERRILDQEGIRGWSVTQHEDWLDRSVEDSVQELKLDDADEKAVDVDGASNRESVESIIDKFRANQPSTMITQDNKSGQITAQLYSQPKPAYIVTCKETSDMQKAMLEAIGRRENQEDLRYLLDMLASYFDVKTRPCQNCRRLLDTNGRFPVVRSKRGTKDTEAGLAPTWDSFHVDCV
ncbi:hypothetical protein MMC06_006701 [Schaereria dolodes]|nr:hypothetical protein [Schaereria dolodes]